MRTITCLIAGHKWRAIPNYDLNGGGLKNIEVLCDRCRVSTGENEVKTQLSAQELEQHRAAWQEFADAMKSLNRIIGA